MPNENDDDKIEDLVGEELQALLNDVALVDVFELVLDPANVNRHPERNLEAIKGSLLAFGQQRGIVARRETKIVVVGNGTVQSMRELVNAGHDEYRFAKVFWSDLTPAEAAAYAIADNKTAKLSDFSFPDLSEQLRALQEEAPELLAATGFVDWELEPLLKANWTPPVVDDAAETGGNDKGSDKGVAFHVNAEQAEKIAAAIGAVRRVAGVSDPKTLTDAMALEVIAREYLDAHPAPADAAT